MKRFLLLLLTGALLLSSLSACGQEPGQPEASPTESAGSEIPDVADPSSGGEPVALAISEVMPDNRSLVGGHEYDWVELYNPNDFAVSLEGYALTDDLSVPDAFPLAGSAIPAGGYLAVILEDSAPFGLSETGESIYLTYGQEALCSLSFPAPQQGESFDGEGAACRFPTPGYANTEEGYRAYLDRTALPELAISEVMAANGAYPASSYNHYDLVEVLNTSDRAISLAGYSLTDKWDGSDRYAFPDVTLQPGEAYVIYCSSNPALGLNHAPFALTPGDTVYLAKQGRLTDALRIPGDLQYNESYGRSGNVPVYLDKPTPGSPNTEGKLTGISAPIAGTAPGVYADPVSVTLTGTGTIYYTTSGARPTTQSRVYTGPIPIDGVTTIRAICVDGGRQSPVANFAYVIGQTHELPILVISVPDSAIWGEYGLHTKVKSDYEYEAVMTLFEDGEAKFSVPFGLCLHGNDSRLGSKKNYQLRFRAEYGLSKLNYHLFDNRDIDEFNSLLLKGGSEDWGISMIRDELATSLADGTSALYTQAKKPVVVYLAGRYWGVHHLRERFSEDYVASHMDVSAQSVSILYSSAAYVQAGSGSSFWALKNYVKTHDMSTNENYAYLCQQIDVTSLMDWYIFRTYMGDTDIANIRRCRSAEGDGKWHWMYFDLDWSFYTVNNYPVTDILTMGGGDRVLIQAVLASPAGRDAFLKRYAYLMGTVLNEEYIVGQIDTIVASIESEMPRDRERWNRSYSGWEAQVQQLRRFAQRREAVILRDLQDYFFLSGSQMEYYFGSLLDD